MRGRLPGVRSGVEVPNRGYQQIDGVITDIEMGDKAHSRLPEAGKDAVGYQVVNQPVVMVVSRCDPKHVRG